MYSNKNVNWHVTFAVFWWCEKLIRSGSVCLQARLC
uniref:Uncharacterized protein n=1 Tax=Anguilla anguilla TaxID=7936 RepID=A0A0E9UP00_ANGAN